MDIIVPAAGLSTRFPGMKPKYLLYSHDHRMMLHQALADLHRAGHRLHIGVLEEHDMKYNVYEQLTTEWGDNFLLHTLEELTSGPAETVYQLLIRSKIPDDAPFLVRDCDSFFEHTVSEGNYVCFSDIADHEVLTRLGSKSFIVSNEQGTITNIVEKKVVSNKFCVGAYKFESAGQYKQYYEKLSSEKEVYVSDVISAMLQDGIIFNEKKVTNYVDVGTAKEWFEYNDKPVIFCDIDGTIIAAQGRVGNNSYENAPRILQNNVNRLLEMQAKGCELIFTTAREACYRDLTRRTLDNLGFRHYRLIDDLPNAKRIIINDYNNANPYPRAEAINLYRDSDNLRDFL